MLIRFAVFVMMALGIGGFGTVAWLTLHTPARQHAVAQAAPLPAAPVHRMVLAASGALQGGTLLKPSDLTALDMTVLPAHALADTQANRTELAGGMLRRGLSAGEVLTDMDVMRPGDHGFLAAVLAPGTRAASIAVDAVSGSAGLIWPGDHVDLILTQALDEADRPIGRRLAAELLLADVRVIAIDQLLAHGVAPSDPAEAARTVTVQVSPQDAERIALAARLGHVSLALRAAQPQPGAVPLQRTVWGGDVSPALAGPAEGGILRVYLGNEDGKEFRF